MAVAVVQSASHSDGSGSSTSVSITLGVAPTVGNLLLYFGSYDLNKNYVGTTSGWTGIGTNPYSVTTGDRAALAAQYRIVQSGDTASWTFPQISPSADTESGILVEVSGQAATGFINGFVETGNATASTTNVSGNVTPSVLNCLALGFFAGDVGAAGTSATDAATITSGWTFLQRAYSDYHPSWLATRTALTSDTTTAINATLTGTSSSANDSIIVLIAPSGGAAAPSTPKTGMLMGIGI